MKPLSSRPQRALARVLCLIVLSGGLLAPGAWSSLAAQTRADAPAGMGGAAQAAATHQSHLVMIDHNA